MPDIQIMRCDWAEIAEPVALYYRERDIYVESYWEDHVLASNHYKLVQSGQLVGFFAVHGGDTLWMFAVLPEAAAQGQALFARARQYEQVTGAIVPTGDECFLCHALDNYARVEKQAYFSNYRDTSAPADAPPITLRRVDPDREEDFATLALSGDFLAEEVEKLKARMPELLVDIVELDGEVAGFAVTQRGKILKEHSSIGLYVMERHRLGGVGAAILRTLRDKERAAGFRPRSGCWYYNHNSKKVQERAGAYMVSRLLHFYF